EGAFAIGRFFRNPNGVPRKKEREGIGKIVSGVGHQGETVREEAGDGFARHECQRDDDGPAHFLSGGVVGLGVIVVGMRLVIVMIMIAVVPVMFVACHGRKLMNDRVFGKWRWGVPAQ